MRATTATYNPSTGKRRIAIIVTDDKRESQIKLLEQLAELQGTPFDDENEAARIWDAWDAIEP